MAPEELLGALELGLGLEVEPPPEAEPDFDSSLDASLEELGGVAEGLDALLELPLEGDEGEPGLGVEGDGEDALPLELPLLPADLPPPLSWPHAARPRAKATATASVESFMSPPWVGREGAAICAPGPSP